MLFTIVILSILQTLCIPFIFVNGSNPEAQRRSRRFTRRRQLHAPPSPDNYLVDFRLLRVVTVGGGVDKDV